MVCTGNRPASDVAQRHGGGAGGRNYAQEVNPLKTPAACTHCRLSKEWWGGRTYTQEELTLKLPATCTRYRLPKPHDCCGKARAPPAPREGLCGVPQGLAPEQRRRCQESLSAPVFSRRAVSVARRLGVGSHSPAPRKSTDRRTHRQTDGQTDRQTGRQTDRQTDGRTDGQTDRQTDGRQTDRQTDRQTSRHSFRCACQFW